MARRWTRLVLPEEAQVAIMRRNVHVNGCVNTMCDAAAMAEPEMRQKSVEPLTPFPVRSKPH